VLQDWLRLTVFVDFVSIRFILMNKIGMIYQITTPMNRV